MTRLCFQLILTIFVMGFLLTPFSCTRNIRKTEKYALFSLSPRIAYGKLDNGLNYYLLRNPEPKGRCLVHLNVAVGSFFEDENELGMAHLLEHLAFDDRSISKEPLTEWFLKNGMSIGPDANAETMPKNTLYKIDLPNCEEKTILTAFKIFRSFADALEFRDEAIVKELNVIDAEEREYNTAQTKLIKRLVNNLYGSTFYVSRPTLGESIKRAAFTKDMIEAFYKKWYTPNNMSVMLVGDFGDADPEKLLNTAFSSMKKASSKNHPKSPNPDYKTPFFALHDDELAHVETVFTIQDKKFTKPYLNNKVLKDKIAFDLAIAMLQEKYLTQFQQSTKKQIREHTIEGKLVASGVYELNLSVASQNDDLEEKFLDAYLVLQRAALLGFSENEFNAERSILRDVLEQAIVSETTMTNDAWAARLLENINDGQLALDATQYLVMLEPILAKLTAKDCQLALKKALSSGNHYLYALGAINEGPATVTRLKELYAKAKKLKPEEASTEKTITFLYQAGDCTSDEIVTMESIPAINARKIKLKNNIEVILKPTKNKTDEVNIEILTSSGEGSMSKTDFAIANLAKIVIFEGGLNKHEASEVTRLIKDKYFSLSQNVFIDRVQASITTRNKDMEFALLLSKAFITDPHYSASAIKGMQERLPLIYLEREHQIWSPTENEFLKALTGDDYRVGLIPLVDLEKISREDLLSWHKRFITDQKLRIVVVGDFDEAEVSKKISCIFADLPEHKNQPSKIAKIAFKSGLKKVYRVARKDEAALIKTRYPLNFTSKPYPDHRLQIVQAVIKEFVRLKLREKQQATYSPTVFVFENKVPTVQNWLDITFTAEKDKAEKIANDLKIFIDKLAKKGIDKGMMTKAIEPYIAEANRSLMQNNYWASLLANNFDDPSLSWATRIEQDVRAIKIKDINQLLQKYFHVKNASTAIVYPTE